MNTIATDSFIAERLPNGDVAITSSGPWHYRFKIIVPEEHCAALAELLCPKVCADYAIDYSNKGEPE